MGCCPSCYGYLESQNYGEAVNDLETGDILLFSGAGDDSCKIKTFTCSPFSHVGVVIRCDHIKEPIYGRRDPDHLYVWHSPSDVLPGSEDVIGKETKNGPQLNALGYELRGTSSGVYVRRLQKYDEETGRRRGGKALADPCGTGIMEFMREASTVPYEKNTWELYRSAWDGPGGHNEKNLSSYFCSELVAQTLMEMGVLSSRANPSNEYVPGDFTRDLPLKNGYKYENKIVRIVPG